MLLAIDIGNTNTVIGIFYKKKLIYKDKVKNREYFNSNFIDQLWKDHIKGKKNYASLFGVLVTFELFLEHFIES